MVENKKDDKDVEIMKRAVDMLLDPFMKFCIAAENTANDLVRIFDISKEVAVLYASELTTVMVFYMPDILAKAKEKAQEAGTSGANPKTHMS